MIFSFESDIEIVVWVGWEMINCFSRFPFITDVNGGVVCKLF
jgi:hypothetical protein